MAVSLGGGGLVIDTGKAVVAMVPATRPLMGHLEVAGKDMPLNHPPLPFIVMPTTSSTGSEVTRNAVIGVPEHRRKVSLRDAGKLPRLAIINPLLTDKMPKSITLVSSLDAITRVIERYISARANAFTDSLCVDAIPRGLWALIQLMRADDPSARNEMAWVSLCGGLALANSGLGVIHALARPLGGLKRALPGAICGAFLQHRLAMNRPRVSDPRLMEQVIDWIGDAFVAPPPPH